MTRYNNRRKLDTDNGDRRKYTPGENFSGRKKEGNPAYMEFDCDRCGKNASYLSYRCTTCGTDLAGGE